MREIKLKQIVKKNKVLLILMAIFLIYLIPCFFLSLPCFTDGLNTLSLDFYLEGYDWSAYLKADGYYYKYGSAIIYYPIFLIIKNPTILYKALLIVNALMTLSIPYLCYKICNKHLSLTVDMSIGISSVIGLLPFITLNNKQTWAEPLLMALTWVILYLLLELSQNIIHKRKDAIKDILGVGFFSTYAYMAHSRGIVILIAAFITTIVVLILNKALKIKYVILFIFLISTLFIIDLKTNGYIRNAFFPQGNLNVNSDISNVLSLDKIKAICTVDGLKTVIRIIAGWCYNIFTSSLGLTALGLLMIANQLYDFIRNKGNKNVSLLIICIFGMLFFVGAFVTGMLFFYDDIRYYYGDVALRRCDKLIYSRYIEPASMIISFLGLYMLAKKWKRYVGIIAWAGFLLVVTFFAFDISGRMDGVVSWTHTLITINGFCDLKNLGRSMVIIENYSVPLIIMGSVSLIVFGVIAFFRRKGFSKIIFVIYCLFFLAIYIRGITNVLIPMDQYYSERVSDVKETIEDLAVTDEAHKIIYLKDELLRCAFQYSFPDYYIVTDRDENKDSIDRMFVVSETPLEEDDLTEITCSGDQTTGMRVYLYEK